jgi:hypothetical protein
MICECPDHLPANPTGGKGIEGLGITFEDQDENLNL